jgi:hypothetical protein
MVIVMMMMVMDMVVNTLLLHLRTVGGYDGINFSSAVAAV